MEKQGDEIHQIVKVGVPIYTKHLTFIRANLEVGHFIYETSEKVGLPQKELKDNLTILEFSSIICISFLDLFVVCNGIINAVLDWEKIYFLKNGYLILNETIEAYKRKEKELNRIFSEGQESMKKEFLSIANDFRKFRNSGKIKTIRNVAAAHIDKDFLNYYDTLKTLTGEEDTRLILEFLGLMRRMEELFKGWAESVPLPDITKADPSKILSELTDALNLLKTKSTGEI